MDPDDAEAAEAAAVRILTGAAQTEVSLRQRLEQRGFSGAAARAAAAAMGSHGYLDDDAFARSLGERRLRQGHGRAWLVAELRSRGVGERPLHDLLRSLDPDDEQDAALQLALRLAARQSSSRSVDPERALSRVAQALARRGYDAATVRRAVREATARGAFGSPGAIPDEE